MAKTQHFEHMNVDLARLANRLVTYFQSEKFETAFSKDSSEPPSWFLVQGRKMSTWRTLAGARRSTDITIRGEPNNFDITAGTGEWGKNIIAAAAPTVLLGGILLPVTITSIYKSKSFEDNLWKFINEQVRFMEGSAAPITLSSSTKNKKTHQQQLQQPITQPSYSDVREYNCDYVEGFPDWNSPIEHGKILLERNKGGKNRIIFKAPDSNEIIIPAESISEAKIIDKEENDLMIQINYKDPSSGNTISPILNLNDSVVDGVLAGINELFADDLMLERIQDSKVIADVKYCLKCGYKLSKEAIFCVSCGTKQQM